MKFNLEDFKSLSDLDIYSMITDENLNSVVKKFLSGYEANDVDSIKEHAFGEFWARMIQKKHSFTNSDIKFIIKEFDNKIWGHIAKGVLGEAAMFNLLSFNQCHNLLEDIFVKEQEWTCRQINARMVLSKNRISKDEIDALINLKTTWAIIECLKKISKDTLMYLYQKVKNENVLTRKNRARVIHEIELLIDIIA
jgi:uncharacterized protein YfkK (UPF0435 family)